MSNNIVKEKISIKGQYHFFSLAPWVTKNSPVMAMLREYIKTKNAALLEQLRRSGAVLGAQYAENLIPTVGRSVLARLLTGDTTYTGEVDWGALGSGSTAFTNASTQLNTEVHRMQATDQWFDDNVANIDWFVAAGDVADQTFEEFGAFIDGSASANSGQAWSLLITGGWVKSGAMYISAQYTINN